MSKVKVCVLGAGFISAIHVESYKRFVSDAQVAAVYTRDRSKAGAFAKEHKIPLFYDDLEQAVRESGCDVVDICLPNFLHHKAVLLAAKYKKHIIIEKPLSLSLEEADEMIAACKAAGVLFMYAEELCFAPKYERARKMVTEGAVKNMYMLKQAEKHSGPHSDWFYNAEMAGGGVLMDMGCHAFAWFQWMVGADIKVKSVYANIQCKILHGNRTNVDENTIVLVEYENGVICEAEDSWARFGGMDDHIEIYGDGGAISADLFMGNSLVTYSNDGYGYAAEKAGDTKGWSFSMFEEAFNQGYPAELIHFIDCVANGKIPLVTAEDGRAVLKIILAAYQSAGSGQKVSFPFEPKNVKKPIDLMWNPIEL